MTNATAQVKNYRAAPRKVRLLADFVRGKKVNQALAELKFVNKRHTKGLLTLINSAVANSGKEASDLKISEIQVQEGQRMKRFRAGSQGRALPMNKRMSHISVILSDLDSGKEKINKKTERKEEKVANDTEK